MDYLKLLNDELSKPKEVSRKEVVLDLFAGCGGLALGFEAAGFKTVGFEKLKDACDTYNRNLLGECHTIVLEPDQDLVEAADVIIGGPPCQPFSVSGLQNGKHDSRDGFPAFLYSVKRYHPELVLIENVRGMLYQNKPYFTHIRKTLADFGYLVEWKLLNAADYGVPQKRERLFVVAHRGVWNFPEPSTPATSFTAGDALGDLAFQTPPGSKFLTKSMDRYVANYEKASFCIRPRDLHLDLPSRTVTCRNLNGATGDMLRVALPDGRRKRLSVREGARLQSFPDWFEFCGAEGSQFNQVGNAVPPMLAKALARSVINYLNSGLRLTPREIKQRTAAEQLCFDFAE
jgi:DNA (cytosine-5)-methyltransferase 1